ARVHDALVVALGRVGDANDVSRLVMLLDGPRARAAAEGLGRMGLRKVPGVSSDAVVLALVKQLDKPIGEARRIAAWALARAPLEGLSSEAVQELRDAALSDTDPRVRAWLVRAAGPLVKDPAFVADAGDDEAAEVRIAALRAMARAGCDLPTIDRGVLDPDTGVRVEALAASIGCEGAALDPVKRLLESGSPAEQAAALRVLDARRALPTALADYQREAWPVAVRIAAVESMNERPRLLRLALRDDDARLRSAATGTLLGGESPPTANELTELLGSRDPVIVQAAAESAIEHPDPVLEKPLLAALGKRSHPRAVAITCVKALDAVYATGRLPRPSTEAKTTIRRHLDAPELAEVARRIGPMLGIDPPRARHPERALPSLAEVLAVRSARVFTTQGEIRIELLPELAPLTVWNFATLAEDGYFAGLVFHRVVPDFVIQTGDPRGDGWGGPGYEIPDELSPESYDVGAVGMALSGPDTGGSQWFVTLSPQPHLDYGYTLFGRVTLGMRGAAAIGVGDSIERVVIERVR
ncbi:MAG: peptidylprolyl isomerase, partial [Deltaproteobacteria bacterium]|nr:peptidylprolyl isomerase [Deltaproteobacteria bacterium]